MVMCLYSRTVHAQQYSAIIHCHQATFLMSWTCDLSIVHRIQVFVQQNFGGSIGFVDKGQYSNVIYIIHRYNSLYHTHTLDCFFFFFFASIPYYLQSHQECPQVLHFHMKALFRPFQMERCGSIRTDRCQRETKLVISIL